MPTKLYEVASHYASERPNSYVYSIVPIFRQNDTDPGLLAALTSADELILLDPRDQFKHQTAFTDLPEGVSCIASGIAGKDELSCSLLAVAGADGCATVYDTRTLGAQFRFKQDRPVTALALRGSEVAIGTELVEHEAVIKLWDIRAARWRWETTELNDDITALSFHPSGTSDNFLLAGSADGTANVFDITIDDPEESLLQAVNHGPIQKAGFVEDRFYALSSDEKLSLYPITADWTAKDLEHDLEGEGLDTPAAVALGDLRPILNCEYVIDLITIGGNSFVATGSHGRDPRVDLVPITASGQLKPNKMLTLVGAHGEDIVRHVYADFSSETVYTAGEDGFVRAFKAF